MADTDVKVAITAEDRTAEAFRSVQESLTNLTGGFGRLGVAAGAAIGSAFVGVMAAAVTAAEEAATSQRKLEAVLRATGNATGYTSDQLNTLAENLSRTTSFDGQAFREATATIVRFGNISGENIERVLRLSADFASMTGQTLPASAQMLAGALNSPAEGMRRLERQFGSLSPEIEGTVRELVRLGDVSGAQAVLLAELERRIGGTDQAVNSGLFGAFNELKKVIGDLLQTIGEAGPNGLFRSFIMGIVEAGRGLNDLLKDLDMDKLKLLVVVLMRPSSVIDVLRGIGRAPVTNPTPTPANPVFGMGFYGPSENDIQVERARRAELLRVQREYNRESERLRQIHLRGEEADLEAQYQAMNEQMAALARVRIADQKERERVAIENARIANAEAEEVFRANERQRLATEGVIQKLRERALQAEAEIELMQMSRPDREKEIALRQLEAAGISRTADGVSELVDRLQTLYAKQEEIASQVSVWNQLGDAAGRFFNDVIFNGRSALDSLRNLLKSFLAELVSVFAKRWVLQIGASLTGSTALSAAAGQVGNGSMAGTFANALMGGSGFGMATIAEFLAGASGTFMGPAAAGSAASMGANFAAFMTNPATLAVLAAVVIAVAVMSRRGGPKEGGSAFGTFDANGNFVPGFAPGTQNGRFYTPSGGDAGMVAMTEGIGSAFAQTLARLGGGSAAGFGFGFGFDRDPRGTASSRVSGIVTDSSGQTILEVINREAGRSEQDLQDALELLGQQSLLAALQRSDLPEAVRAILQLVDAASATSEDIDGILSLASAFVAVTNSLSDISVDDIVRNASATAVDQFRAQGNALVELANRSSLTTQSLATLAQETGSYRAAAEALIGTLEVTRLQIDQMFGQTRRNIQMAGLSDDERRAFLEREISSWVSALSGASTADEIARLAQFINTNLSELFSGLSPEDQQRLRDSYLARVDEVNTSAQERIRQLQIQAQEEANRQLAEVRRIMDEMALAQKSAADTQQAAADKQLQAANTPIKLDINFDIASGSATVTEGG